jgi:putative Mg2+ transporter-C (MgtC) family protein
VTITADLTFADTALRLAAAAAFGAVLGFEREVQGHDAGARTHLLLALGAAIFGVLSIGAFDGLITDRNGSNVSFDPSRIASYVAAGVGFLGGGAILKREDRVVGLTTGASLWTVAAIGLAAGLGFWPAAVVGTVIALVALLADAPVARLAARLGRDRAKGGGGRS